LLGVSSGSGPTVGAYAFKLAMELLNGQIKEANLPHNIQFPLPWVPWDQVKVGDPLNPAKGGNTWPLNQVPAVFAAGIYYPDLVPEVNYDSALNGKPVPSAKIQPIDPSKIVKAPDVPGINSDTKTQPPGLFDLNAQYVTPIPPS
jgi:ribose transport system substrate-binding protein